jgi:hypothetical protein
MARGNRDCNGWVATTRRRGAMKSCWRQPRSVARPPVSMNQAARSESTHYRPAAWSCRQKLELLNAGLRRRSAGSNAVLSGSGAEHPDGRGSGPLSDLST